MVESTIEVLSFFGYPIFWVFQKITGYECKTEVDVLAGSSFFGCFVLALIGGFFAYLLGS